MGFEAVASYFVKITTTDTARVMRELLLLFAPKLSTDFQGVRGINVLDTKPPVWVVLCPASAGYLVVNK